LESTADCDSQAQVSVERSSILNVKREAADDNIVPLEVV
jgi:hypothetical protein